MNTPSALFFDLDETLVYGRTAESLAEACRTVAAAESGLDADRLLKANSVVWAEYWPQMEEAWTLGKLSTAELTLEAWVRTLKACNCLDVDLAELASKTAWQCHCDSFRLFDDVLPLLDALDGQFPCALITNGASDLQWKKLRRTGIDRRFDSIVISAEHGVAKPSGAAFRAAFNALGLERPESAWHIGDSLRTDVGGANAAGITSIWLNRAGVKLRPEDPRPDYEISTLTELAALIQGSESLHP